MWGFNDECHLSDNTFQPYGQIMIMGLWIMMSNKQWLTDTIWEDSMSLYMLNEYLA